MLEDNFFKGTMVRVITTGLPIYTNYIGMAWDAKKREWLSVDKVAENFVLKKLNAKEPIGTIEEIANQAWLSPVSFEVFETDYGLQYLVPVGKDKPLNTNNLFHFSFDIPLLHDLTQSLKEIAKQSGDRFVGIHLLNNYRWIDGKEVASKLFPTTKLNGFKVDYFKIGEVLNPLSVPQAITIGDGPIPEEHLPKYQYQTRGSISRERESQRFHLEYSLTTKIGDPSSLSSVIIRLHVEGDDSKDYRMTFFGNESGWYQLNANDILTFSRDGKPQLFEYGTPFITDVF